MAKKMKPRGVALSSMRAVEARLDAYGARLTALEELARHIAATSLMTYAIPAERLRTDAIQTRRKK